MNDIKNYKVQTNSINGWYYIDYADFINTHKNFNKTDNLYCMFCNYTTKYERRFYKHVNKSSNHKLQTHKYILNNCILNNHLL